MSQVATSGLSAGALVELMNEMERDLGGRIEIRLALSEGHTARRELELITSSFRPGVNIAGQPWHVVRLHYPTPHAKNLLGALYRGLWKLQDMHEAEKVLERVGK